MSSRSRPGLPPGEPDWSRPGPGDYQPPADPWGQPTDAWGNPISQPGGHSAQPGGHPDQPGGYRAQWGGYRDQPGGRQEQPAGYPQPPPAPPPRRNLGLYAVVAAMVLLAAAGVGYALYVLSGDDGGAEAGPTPATGTGSPGPSASPRDNIGLSAVAARVDDCLVNDGTSAQTQMRIVRCDGDNQGVVFRVLAVIDGRVDGADDDDRQASAQAVCAGTEGYTHHYFEVGEQSSFVLCMAEQE